MTCSIPAETRLVEVGLRDGLQVVKKPLATSEKLKLVHMLLASGIREIEAVSFAHPRVLPQLGDAEALMYQVPRAPDIVYRGLVPNLRGAERAAEAGIDTMVALTCTDDTISLINQNRTVEEVLSDLPKIGKLADKAGSRLVVGVAMAFFAPGRGDIPEDERHRCIDRAVDAGASGIYLACSSGMDHPRQVFDGVADLRARHPNVEVGVHLHARNGMGLANALAGLMAGAHWLEGAFGGLGGDLWSPGSAEIQGNVPFEDLLHLTSSMGIDTGISLDKYLAVVHEVAAITGYPPRSAVIAGGTRADLVRHKWTPR